MTANPLATRPATAPARPQGVTPGEGPPAALNRLLADVFAVYVMTKNFHWHVSGPHFREYHALLEEQAGEVLAVADPLAERVRKLGARTLRSIGDIAALHGIAESDGSEPDAREMLLALAAANRLRADGMAETQRLCDDHGDWVTAGLLDGWIDEAQGRLWFLAAATSSSDEEFAPVLE